MLTKIDDALLAATTALVVGLHRRFGMDRHSTIRELITAGVVCVAVASVLVMLTLPAVLAPLGLVFLFMERRFPARWKEADARSRASSTYEGWRTDMELAAIHMRIRETDGRRFLVVDLSLATFYLLHVFLWLSLGSTEAAGMTALLLVRSICDTVCRYALMVPPPPPGTGRSRRTVGDALPDAA